MPRLDADFLTASRIRASFSSWECSFCKIWSCLGESRPDRPLDLAGKAREGLLFWGRASANKNVGHVEALEKVANDRQKLLLVERWVKPSKTKSNVNWLFKHLSPAENLEQKRSSALSSSYVLVPHSQSPIFASSVELQRLGQHAGAISAQSLREASTQGRLAGCFHRTWGPWNVVRLACSFQP